jgi:glycosyltransferase 2 family protein
VKHRFLHRFRPRLPHTVPGRVALALPLMGIVAVLLYWRGPSLSGIGDAFVAVKWQWVVLAVALNLLSVLVRALAWNTVIRQAIPAPYPAPILVFSAFSVGLFANAVLPGRIGELARVAVLTRKLPRRKGLWATLVGTVFAHRVFDVVPVLLLILYVVITAKIPAWAISILLGIVGVGIGLFAFAFFSARTKNVTRSDGLGAARRLVAMARSGLGVMRTPLGMSIAAFFQICGWLFQLLAVWAAMRAFDIHAPLPAAGVVLLVMNVVTIFPFWPGNVGALQVAIAAPLVSYGVAYPHGVAYGFGLQAIEASVGIGIGLLFLAREGLSFAMLQVMPSAAQAELSDQQDVPAPDVEAVRAGVPG